jgi:hypothetical protein
MNHHGVQGVFHLVRHSRRQASQGRQLSRIANRRLDLAQVLDVAGDEHDANEVTGPIVHGMRQEQALTGLPSGFSEGC